MNTKMHQRRTYSFSASKSSGFTLIEVMVAILVLGVGLLSFALLQTMSVRFTQSANQRTKATNLAAELLEQMRSNRIAAANYQAATFAGGAVPANCAQNVGNLSINDNIARWQCTVLLALGDGASATVTFDGDNIAVVRLGWGDQHWEGDAARRTGNYETGQLTMRTQL